MQYKKLKNSEIQISSITLGTWVFGGHFWNGAKAKDCMDAVACAIDLGINCIDTAPIYSNGESERLVGKAIRGKRGKVFLATKCGLIGKGDGIDHNLTSSSIRNEIEASLRRLKTDHIDLYQCHWPDSKTSLDETFKTLNELKTEGKILHIGVSNYGADLLANVCQHFEIVTTQDQYSLLDRNIEQELIPLTNEKNIGILAYGPLAGGILTGKYHKPPVFKYADARKFFYKFYEGDAFRHVQAMLNEFKSFGKPLNQIAINWVRQQPQVLTVLAGCRNRKQVEENVAALSWDLSQDELMRINDLSRAAIHG